MNQWDKGNPRTAAGRALLALKHGVKLPPEVLCSGCMQPLDDGFYPCENCGYGQGRTAGGDTE